MNIANLISSFGLAPNDEEIKIGTIKRKFLISNISLLSRNEVLTEKELNHHVHVVGASGFGKTVLLMHIIKNRIEKGKGLVFVDLKGDMETISQLKDFVVNSGREKDLLTFSLTDLQNSKTYNLIKEGTATQLRDKIMLSLNWSEEFYKNQAGSFLLKLLIGLCYLRDNNQLKLDLPLILQCLTKRESFYNKISLIPERLEKERHSLEECYRFLEDKENYKSLQGLRSQLESLVLSDFGDLLKESEAGINLFEAYKQSKIIFIYLDSRKYGESAKAVGKFILQDLKMTSSKVDAEIPKHQRKQFVCIIDEFADLASEDVSGFLDRARSAKMSIVIAHQEICDLLRISPEFAGRLMGNTSTLYAFLQKRPESAELISGIGGTKSAWKTTKQTERLLFFEMESGGGSKREVEEFNIHPNLVKSLSVGKCVCIKKYPQSKAYLVDVNPM